jgi:hypothetical protein
MHLHHKILNEYCLTKLTVIADVTKLYRRPGEIGEIMSLVIATLHFQNWVNPQSITQQQLVHIHTYGDAQYPATSNDTERCAAEARNGR